MVPPDAEIVDDKRAMEAIVRIPCSFPIYAIAPLSSGDYVYTGGGGRMASGVENACVLFSYDESTDSFERIHQLSLEDSGKSIAVHGRSATVVLGVGVKKFIIKGKKLTPVSRFQHDVIVSSSIEQSVVALSADGARMALGASNGSICVLALPRCNRLFESSLIHNDDVTDLDVSPDGSLVASTGRWGRAVLSDSSTGHIIQIINPVADAPAPRGPAELRRARRDGTVNEVRGVRFPRKGNFFISAESSSVGTYVAVWHPASPNMQLQKQQHQAFTVRAVLRASRDGAAVNLAITPDGRKIAIATAQGHVVVLRHDIANANVVRVWGTEGGLNAMVGRAKVAHEFPVTGLLFSHGEKRLFTTSGDNTMAVWDVRGKLTTRRVSPIFAFFLLIAAVLSFVVVWWFRARAVVPSRGVHVSGPRVTTAPEIMSEEENATLLHNMTVVPSLGTHVAGRGVMTKPEMQREVENMTELDNATSTLGPGRSSGMDNVPVGQSVESTRTANVSPDTYTSMHKSGKATATPSRTVTSASTSSVPSSVPLLASVSTPLKRGVGAEKGMGRKKELFGHSVHQHELTREDENLSDSRVHIGRRDDICFRRTKPYLSYLGLDKEYGDERVTSESTGEGEVISPVEGESSPDVDSERLSGLSRIESSPKAASGIGVSSSELRKDREDDSVKPLEKNISDSVGKEGIKVRDKAVGVTSQHTYVESTDDIPLVESLKRSNTLVSPSPVQVPLTVQDRNPTGGRVGFSNAFEGLKGDEPYCPTQGAKYFLSAASGIDGWRASNHINDDLKFVMPQHRDGLAEEGRKSQRFDNSIKDAARQDGEARSSSHETRCSAEDARLLLLGVSRDHGWKASVEPVVHHSRRQRVAMNRGRTTPNPEDSYGESEKRQDTERVAATVDDRKAGDATSRKQRQRRKSSKRADSTATERNLRQNKKVS